MFKYPKKREIINKNGRDIFIERKNQKEIYINSKNAITLTESASFDFPDIQSIINNDKENNIQLTLISSFVFKA